MRSSSVAFSAPAGGRRCISTRWVRGLHGGWAMAIADQNLRPRSRSNSPVVAMPRAENRASPRAHAGALDTGRRCPHRGTPVVCRRGSDQKSVFLGVARKARRRRNVGGYAEQAQRREWRSGARTLDANFRDGPPDPRFVSSRATLRALSRYAAAAAASHRQLERAARPRAARVPASASQRDPAIRVRLMHDSNVRPFRSRSSSPCDAEVCRD